ncbi:MAG: hypothetical protein EBE86_001010 [Hormoscilla sp. GUM202]|nr:hypothetical protein [Hormoscilla sp. GUM202]
MYQKYWWLRINNYGPLTAEGEMTRFIYDQFHKDYLDEFLKCCGEVQIDK